MMKALFPAAATAGPLLVLISLLPSVIAQSSAWEQCGGTSWKGSTTCISGSVCTYVSTQFSFCLLERDSKPNYWFSFGDSYSETGFKASGTLPAIGNPLGNPQYPGRTAVGGENWVDFLTTTYNKSLILTYNPSWGGATIDSNLVTSGQGVSLTDEVNTFLSKFASKPASTPWEAHNTLFSVWIGINDIGYSYDLGGDRDPFTDRLLNAYFALVEKLGVPINVGLDSHRRAVKPAPEITSSSMCLQWNAVHMYVVMFLALPTLNQTMEKAVIDGYNRKLQTRIDWFEGNHSDIQLRVWDAHGTFNFVLDNPTAFGFKDATSYGSNDPNYFWSGNYHPSTAAHRIFAKAVRDVLQSGVW
ncbi:hypothetical protein AX15_004390 [Amanita polypyramis BW_CC]|nr:hypothetical protein AX15_004390 [Amanita polypyramis BW_CC]